jgi:hypothetical protein
MGVDGLFRPLAREDEMGRGVGSVNLLLEARSVEGEMVYLTYI